jgi:hypothetical protein
MRLSSCSPARSTRCSPESAHCAGCVRAGGRRCGLAIRLPELDGRLDVVFRSEVAATWVALRKKAQSPAREVGHSAKIGVAGGAVRLAVMTRVRLDVVRGSAHGSRLSGPLLGPSECTHGEGRRPSADEGPQLGANHRSAISGRADGRSDGRAPTAPRGHHQAR